LILTPLSGIFRRTRNCRQGRLALSILQQEAGEFIHVPSICLVELTYLVEKGRLPAAARDLLIKGAG